MPSFLAHLSRYTHSARKEVFPPRCLLLPAEGSVKCDALSRTPRERLLPRKRENDGGEAAAITRTANAQRLTFSSHKSARDEVRSSPSYRPRATTPTTGVLKGETFRSNPLIHVATRRVAVSGGIKHTDRQIDRQTDRPTDRRRTARIEGADRRCSRRRSRNPAANNEG